MVTSQEFLSSLLGHLQTSMAPMAVADAPGAVARGMISGQSLPEAFSSVSADPFSMEDRVYGEDITGGAGSGMILELLTDPALLLGLGAAGLGGVGMALSRGMGSAAGEPFENIVRKMIDAGIPEEEAFKLAAREEAQRLSSAGTRSSVDPRDALEHFEHTQAEIEGAPYHGLNPEDFLDPGVELGQDPERFSPVIDALLGIDRGKEWSPDQLLRNVYGNTEEMKGALLATSKETSETGLYKMPLERKAGVFEQPNNPGQTEIVRQSPVGLYQSDLAKALLSGESSALFDPASEMNASFMPFLRDLVRQMPEGSLVTTGEIADAYSRVSPQITGKRKSLWPSDAGPDEIEMYPDIQVSRAGAEQTGLSSPGDEGIAGYFETDLYLTSPGPVTGAGAPETPTYYGSVEVPAEPAAKYNHLQESVSGDPDADFAEHLISAIESDIGDTEHVGLDPTFRFYPYEFDSVRGMGADRQDVPYLGTVRAVPVMREGAEGNLEDGILLIEAALDPVAAIARSEREHLVIEVLQKAARGEERWVRELQRLFGDGWGHGPEHIGIKPTHGLGITNEEELTRILRLREAISEVVAGRRISAKEALLRYSDEAATGSRDDWISAARSSGREYMSILAPPALPLDEMGISNSAVFEVLDAAIKRGKETGKQPAFIAHYFSDKISEITGKSKAIADDLYGQPGTQGTISYQMGRISGSKGQRDKIYAMTTSNDKRAQFADGEAITYSLETPEDVIRTDPESRSWHEQYQRWAESSAEESSEFEIPELMKYEEVLEPGPRPSRIGSAIRLERILEEISKSKMGRIPFYTAPPIAAALLGANAATSQGNSYGSR